MGTRAVLRDEASRCWRKMKVDPVVSLRAHWGRWYGLLIRVDDMKGVESERDSDDVGRQSLRAARDRDGGVGMMRNWHTG